MQTVNLLFLRKKPHTQEVEEEGGIKVKEGERKEREKPLFLSGRVKEKRGKSLSCSLGELKPTCNQPLRGFS